MKYVHKDVRGLASARAITSYLLNKGCWFAMLPSRYDDACWRVLVKPADAKLLQEKLPSDDEELRVKYRDYVSKNHATEDFEVDDDAMISGDDVQGFGAFVQTWTWVYRGDIDDDNEPEFEDDDEPFDEDVADAVREDRESVEADDDEDMAEIVNQFTTESENEESAELDDEPPEDDWE